MPKIFIEKVSDPTSKIFIEKVLEKVFNFQKYSLMLGPLWALVEIGSEKVLDLGHEKVFGFFYRCYAALSGL